MKGCIRQRGQSYQLIVYNGVNPKTGKKQYESKTIKGRSRREAETELAKMITAIINREYKRPSKETIEEFLDFWIDNYAKARLKIMTYKSYRTIIKQHLNPKLGKTYLDRLTPTDIIKYCDDTQAKGMLDRQGNVTNQPLTARTVRSHFRVLHKALNDAVRWGKIHSNPLDLVTPPRPVDKEMKFLTSQEVKRFLSAAKNDRLYPLYLTAVYLGMRRGEILGLRWKDVNLKAKALQVRQQLLKPGKKPIFGSPKSKAGLRKLELPLSLVKELEKWQQKQQEEKDFNGDTYVDYGLVFCQQDGNPICHGSMDRWSFKKILKQAKLPDIRFHDLRHTCASLLLSHGVHPKVVQEILGHSNIQTVLTTYSHVIQPLHRKAIRLWDQFQKGESND